MTIEQYVALQQLRGWIVAVKSVNNAPKLVGQLNDTQVNIAWKLLQDNLSTMVELMNHLEDCYKIEQAREKWERESL